MTKIRRHSEWHVKRWRQSPWRFSLTIDGDLAIDYVANSCYVQMVWSALLCLRFVRIVIIKP
jgi:hypothetical protein